MRKQILAALIVFVSLTACSFSQSSSCPDIKEESVHFAFNSYELTGKDKETLLIVSEKMKLCPYLKTVVTGYTDSIGSSTYNFKLGDKRAESVKLFLIKEGIPSYQIQVKSMGEKDPIASNSTENGRAENRRAAIRFY